MSDWGLSKGTKANSKLILLHQISKCHQIVNWPKDRADHVIIGTLLQKIQTHKKTALLVQLQKK